MENKDNSRTFIILAAFFVGIWLSALLCGLYARSCNEKKDQRATEVMLSGDYETALILFEGIKDFRGVDAKIIECEKQLGYEVCPECGYIINRGDSK